jgi:fatty-acyl-CoA synthase
MTTVADLVLRQSTDEGIGLLAPGCAPVTHRQVAASAASRALRYSELHRAGAEPHIGVLLDNTAEFVFWLEAAALAGAAVVGVNPTRRGAELARDIRHAECEVLVTQSSYLPLLDGLPDLGVPVMVVDGPAYAGALSAFADATVGDVRPVGPVTEATRLLLYFTSGSTGAPKAVTCVQGRLAASGEVMAERFALTARDVCYIPMPMFHGNAILANWGPALVAGAAVALRERFSASGFLDDVRRCQATYFTYVGRAVSYILATPERPDDADNSLRAGFGTEAGPVDRARFERRFGCPLAEGYGSSEGGINIVAPRSFPASVARRGSVVGQGDPTLSIVDPETGAACPAGEFDAAGRLLNGAAAIGELVKAGTGVFSGYWKNPEADAERISGGLYRSGDLFYADEDGWLYFAARKADRMRVDGENISVALLEAILARWGPVEAAAAYAVPDAVTGDAVMCALVVRPAGAGAADGADPVGFDAARFAAFLADQDDLGTKMAPRFVRITRELATTATVKVSRYALRDEGWWRVGGDEVWYRPGAGLEYVPLEGPLLAELRNRHATHGRSPG